MINHVLKVAIEVKDDTRHKTIMPTPENPFVIHTTDVKKMSEILLDHIRDARQKFLNYPSYKKILLFRTEHRIIRTVRYAIDGLHTYTRTNYLGKVQPKYSRHIKENIGCYIIYDYEGNYHYIPNMGCKNKSEMISKTEAELILEIPLKEVEEV